MQTELIKVDALPPHRDLDHTVQLTQRAGARHQHAPPHHRADLEQPNLDLRDLGRVGIGRGRGSFNDRSGSLRGSRHPASLSSIALPRRGHPRHPDALQRGSISTTRVPIAAEGTPLPGPPSLDSWKGLPSKPSKNASRPNIAPRSPKARIFRGALNFVDDPRPKHTVPCSPAP